MKKLEGGFINQVYMEDGVVIKIFDNDLLVGISSAERFKKETEALKIFGGTVAPRLISSEGVELRQEFIEGESYETRARRGEDVFQTAGALLNEIHNRGAFNNQPLQKNYQIRFEKAMALAEPILKLEQLSPVFNVSWKIVSIFGASYIHGDFWLGNILGERGAKPKAIDWEFSGIGSPYEDFAIADLWIFREFADSSKKFWKGYGREPDKKTIDEFLMLRCVEFLATTTLEKYILEEKDGFYHNKIAVLKTLCV